MTENTSPERTTLATPRAALVRAVPAAFDRCLQATPSPIDVPRAREQHAAYVAALIDAGLDVEVLPALDELPDSVFVEDAAVVLGRSALLARPGARSRREEPASLRDALARHHGRVDSMAAPAQLDGGDVLRAGRLLFVGRSRRTNAAGIAALRTTAAREGLETIEIPVERGLHLKSACTIVDSRTLLFDPTALDASPLASAGLHCIPIEPSTGANVLALGARVLVPASAPGVADTVDRLGFQAVPLDIGEFEAADGGLTCLSLRLAAPDHWAT